MYKYYWKEKGLLFFFLNKSYLKIIRTNSTQAVPVLTHCPSPASLWGVSWPLAPDPVSSDLTAAVCAGQWAHSSHGAVCRKDLPYASVKAYFWEERGREWKKERKGRDKEGRKKGEKRDGRRERLISLERERVWEIRKRERKRY